MRQLQDSATGSLDFARDDRRRTVGIEAALWYTNHMLRFAKMNGAGNDFVMIDNRAGNVQLSAQQIAKICDRHRGVGADGVLLVERSDQQR